MQNIIIDEEFRLLLPELDAETFRLLEESILEHGCRDALVLWGDTLVDGHNRYNICTKHDVPFKTVNKDFASREEALIWIVTTQISRRNLTNTQLSYYRGLHYRAEKAIKGTYDRNVTEVNKPQNGVYQNSTAKRLADQYDVSRNTITRDYKYANAIDAIGEASPEARRMLIAGEAKVSKKQLEELSALPENEVAEIALKIEEGIYNKKTTSADAPAQPAAPLDKALAGVDPLDAAISKISIVFQTTLPGITKKADKTKLQTKLRSSIDALEALYGLI